VEKEKPRTNPRAGSNDPELWDTGLDWYFNVFESSCGLQSIGTSGAGENELTPPTEEEKADKRERIRNGFLLTLPGNAKADAHSVSPHQADKAAFAAMAHGVFRRGRQIWKRLTRLSHRAQVILKRAYEERLPEAGADWGRRPLTDDQVRAAHRQYFGKLDEVIPLVTEPLAPPRRTEAWRNPTPCGRRHEWAKEVHHE